MNTTTVRRFCRGIVLEDKDPNSTSVKVWPYEILPILDGVVSAELDEWHNGGIDHNAKEWEVTLKTGHWLECEWFHDETNRVTPPDLKRREKVTIWRVADSHRYYWTTDGREDHLRRLEHVVKAYSDVPPSTLEDVELTGDNCYTHTVSTRDGLIHWRTAKTNDEDFLYDLIIDTKNNFAMLTDDTLNRFSIDSTERIVRMENADGTFMEMNKENIIGYAPNNWQMEAVEGITFKCKTFNLTATDSVTVDTKAFKVTASSSFKVDSPESSFTGNVNVGKNLTVTGNYTGSGGKVAFTSGTATFGIPLTATKVSSTQPISAPNV